MYVNADIIIKAAAVLGALITIGTSAYKVIKWLQKQEEQTADIEKLRQQEQEDIAQLKEENTLIVFALSACLDGLEQLGANHTVPVARDKLNKYINKQAHK